MKGECLEVGDVKEETALAPATTVAAHTIP